MRQNLLGHNLLNMSLYNAAQQRQQQQQRASEMSAQQQQAQAGYYGHAHTHPVYGVDNMPSHYPHQTEYELDPYAHPGYPGHPGHPGHAGYGGPAFGYGPEYAEDMYLPPIGYDEPAYEVRMDPYYGQGHPHPYGHYGPDHPMDRGYPVEEAYLPGPGGDGGEYDMQESYRLPPLLHQASSIPTSAVPGGLHARVEDEDERGEDPRVRDWRMAEQTTPSGHVAFDERLFDGALSKEDGLGDFDDAMRQANEMW
jgi:hypothetical protein